MDNPLYGQSRPPARQRRAFDRQLSPDTERGAFLHRQGGVGSVEGEPPDTSGLPQRGTHSLHPVGRQNLLPLHPCIGDRRLTG